MFGFQKCTRHLLNQTSHGQQVNELVFHMIDFDLEVQIDSVKQPI